MNMSEEQIESIFQHACEGAAESIGSTRANWQSVVDAIRELRRERDEARRLLDEARAQVPVAYEISHESPADIPHYKGADVFTADKIAAYESHGFTVRPLTYAAPVPAQPAADVAAIAKAVRDIPSRIESLGAQRKALCDDRRAVGGVE